MSTNHSKSAKYIEPQSWKYSTKCYDNYANNLCVHLSIRLHHQSIHVFIHPSICPSVHPSVHPFIHPSIHHLLTSCYVGHKTNSSQYSWTEFNCVRNSGDVFAIPRRIHKNDCVHIITHKQYDCCNYIRRVWSIDIETSARTR